jgi:hypothetical protein
VSTDSETSISRGFLGNHTYSCALPVRGGVCDCQSDYDRTTDPWPDLSIRRSQTMQGGSGLPQVGGMDAWMDAGLSA